MVIQGYRIKTTDISEILKEMDKVKNKLKKITCREYNRLISKEVTFLVDQISLNVITRDNNVTIFDGALQNVNERIERAEFLNTKCDYNFRIFAHIMPYEDYSYIKVTCLNEALLVAFKNLEEYSVNEEECNDKHNAKTILWNKLHEQYKKSEPMLLSLTQTPEANKEELQFKNIRERAEVEARNSIISRILSEISGGKEINPIRLIPYIDEATNIFYHNMTVEYRDKVTNLMSILINLEKDHEFIFHLPNEPESIPDVTSDKYIEK